MGYIHKANPVCVHAPVDLNLLDDFHLCIRTERKQTDVCSRTVILEGDIAAAARNGTIDHNEHPGLKNKTGHIGFLGHGDVMRFRKMRVKRIET